MCIVNSIILRSWSSWIHVVSTLFCLSIHVKHFIKQSTASVFMTVCSSCPFSSSLLFALVLHRFPSNQQTSWFYACSCGCRRSASCWRHNLFSGYSGSFFWSQNYRLFIVYRKNCLFTFTLIELMKCEISLSNKTTLGQSELSEMHNVSYGVS